MLTITEVSRRSGVASSALRFYEERGLIASERAGSGHRRYPRSVLRRIAFIVFAQRIGLTLEEIGAELAKLPADRVPTRRDWARLSGEWTKRDRPAHCRTAALEAGPDRMHRLRLPVDRPLQPRQSGRPGRPHGSRAALLDGMKERFRPRSDEPAADTAEAAVGVRSPSQVTELGLPCRLLSRVNACPRGGPRQAPCRSPSGYGRRRANRFAPRFRPPKCQPSQPHRGSCG